ncbi:MAG: flagellar motor protein [Acidobacteriaceae bacterium]|nr:flagellar motor protein [Acidobacteriaceae bacterium]
MAASEGGSRPDLASICGLVLAVGGILGGLILEKGSLRDVAQFTAAMIVVGGTLGAVMVNTPFDTLKAAAAQLKLVLFEPKQPLSGLIDEIIVYATKARKQGIVSLESDAMNIADPFLRKAVNLAVDGTDIDDLRAMMELEIDLAEHSMENVAKVFDNGGGYAPTIGIIGAVLGLIQVMKNLANLEEVGHGIAVAFVATVYGVGLANVFLLPAGGKIRARAAKDRQTRELTLAGVIGIVEGANPKLIRNKLNAYLADGAAGQQSKRAAAPRAA